MAGLSDGDPGSETWTTAERLRELRTVENNWDHLEFRMERTFPKIESRLYEMIGGFAAFGGPGHNTQVRGLTFIELPSAIRGTTERSWEINDLGINIRDFTMEPLNDLLVLIESPQLVG